MASDGVIRMRQPKKKITEEVLRRMDLPKHYWNVTRDEITAKIGGRDEGLVKMIDIYLSSRNDMWRKGVGLILIGPNGVGKTCAAAFLAKEFRALNKPVLFAPADSVLDKKKKNEIFEHNKNYTYWEWMKRVSVLILDDLGKEADTWGDFPQMWDELFRARLGAQLITIVTTNFPIRGSESTGSLEQVLKRTTLSFLKESFIPIVLKGDDLRENRMKELHSIMKGGLGDDK